MGSSRFNKAALGFMPNSSKFNLSHEVKKSMKMGYLYPMLCEEVVPGDRFRIRTETLMRMAPMLSPVMHRVNIRMEYFFVPNRLLMNEQDWEDFITGGEDGMQEPILPYMTVSRAFGSGNFDKGSLSDHFGIPPVSENSNNSYTLSALPFKAYTLIWNEYYRDQNLQPKVDIGRDSTGNISAGEVDRITQLRKRAWGKDYFTSALPWTQRGGAAAVPFEAKLNSPVIAGVGEEGYGADGPVSIDGGELVDSNNDRISLESANQQGSGQIAIEDIRRTARLQEWLEKSARAGSRYIEHIFAHFGVKSKDSRLQRPEYLGGARQPMVISEVLQMAEGTQGSVGEMYGHGISVGSKAGFSRKFTEHGFVIGLISVLPITAYQQGVSRMWTRKDKFDFYQPLFANLGEQPVRMDEIFVDYNAMESENGAPFGYQERYAEYKFRQDQVHGDFRDNLAFWHMGRIFDSKPALNASFVESDPTKRIFAVEDEDVDELWCQLYHDFSAIRKMPYHSIPTL